MKKNLYGVLLGGALLASCTSDDVLNVSASQEVNPQAPVFVIHSEDDTRATMDEKGDVHLYDGDLLSLFHGAKDYANSPYDFKGYSNAIYEGRGAAEGFVLTTRSMVNAGGAIMVYPADVAFRNFGGDGNTAVSTNNPVIDFSEIIPAQNEETRKLTPYMSEVIKIEEYSGNDNAHEAGYGRKYDVALKRVGTTLELTPNPTQDNQLKALKDIDPLAFSEVEIAVTKNDAPVNIFTTQVEITSSSELSYGKTHPTTTNPAHPHWANATVAKAVLGAATNDIKYTLGEGETFATFTLLPLLAEFADAQVVDNPADNNAWNAAANNVLGRVQSAQRSWASNRRALNQDVKAFDEVTVTVHTNYGKVEVTNKSGNVWYRGDYPADKGTIVNGLAYYLQHAFDKSAGNNFNGESVGWITDRVVDVDMRNLDMNDLHIKDEKQLIDAVKVLGTMANKKVTLILDGGQGRKEKNPVNEFTIKTKDGRDAYQTALGYGAKFALCAKDGEACTTIVFKNTEGNVVNVPARLEFVQEDSKGNNSEIYTDYPVVRFEGEWLLDNDRRYYHVLNLEVATNGTLELKGDVRAKSVDNKELIEIDNDLMPILVNKGTVNVNEKQVYLKLNMANYGTLNIGSTSDHTANLTLDSYKAGEGLTLANMATTAATGLDKGEEVSRGKIHNHGLLQIAAPSGSEINNYGVVYIENNDAITLLTNNSTTEANVAKPINCTVVDNKWNSYKMVDDANVIGLVYLHKDGNEFANIAKEEAKGFVIQKITAETVDGKTVSKYANYIILESSVKTVNELPTGEDVVRNEKLNELYLKYVDIRSSRVNLYCSTKDLSGMIVREGAVAVVTGGAEITTAVSHHEGTTTVAGVLNGGMIGTTTAANYFGWTNAQKCVGTSGGGTFTYTEAPNNP